jgi:hypothetical protein
MSTPDLSGAQIFRSPTVSETSAQDEHSHHRPVNGPTDAAEFQWRRSSRSALGNGRE